MNLLDFPDGIIGEILKYTNVKDIIFISKRIHILIDWDMYLKRDFKDIIPIIDKNKYGKHVLLTKLFIELKSINLKQNKYAEILAINIVKLYDMTKRGVLKL